MNQIPRELAPCGVFCGACPSFDKTCLGCPSQNRTQQRTSKWGCKIRHCCYNTKGKDFCMDCAQFPCTTHKKKLLNTHAGEPRFRYRHEIPQIFERLQTLGRDDYLEFQKQRWSCPYCGGRVHFHRYQCSECGREVRV